MRAGAQQLQGRLKADLDAGAGNEGVVAAQVRGLLALGIVELAAGLAQGIVVAMHDREGLLADVAVALLDKCGAGLGRVRLRPLEPERRIDLGAPLQAQARPLNDAAVMFLGDLALGAPKAFEHSRHIVALRLGDEPGEHQQFAALLLAQSRELRAVGLDGTQHAHAGEHIFIGQCRVGCWMGVHPRIVCCRRNRRNSHDENIGKTNANVKPTPKHSEAIA